MRGDDIQTIRGETETFTEYTGEHYVENYMGVGIAQTPNPLSYGYQGSFNRSQVPNIFSGGDIRKIFIPPNQDITSPCLKES